MKKWKDLVVSPVVVIAAAAGLVAFLGAARPAKAQVYEPLPVIAPVNPGERIPGKKPARPLRNSISIQGSVFKYNETLSITAVNDAEQTGSISLSSKLGILGAADFGVGRSLDLGAWFSADKQNINFSGKDLRFTPPIGESGSGHQNSSWSEFHASILAIQKPKATVAVSVGYLSDRLTQDATTTDPAPAPAGSVFTYEQNGTLHWTELALEGAVPLGGSAHKAAPVTLGLTIGHMFGTNWTSHFTVTDQTTGKGATASGPLNSGNGTSYGASLSYSVQKAISIDTAYWAFHTKENSTIRRFTFGAGYHF